MNFQPNIAHSKKYIENLLTILFAGVVSFFFLLKSPLHPWIGSETGTDSSVFKTIALAMEKGFMPYKDSFDHKGPLLYILNFCGNKISEYKGIWLIELLFMTITLVMIYKITRLSCRISSSIIITFTSLALLFNYFEGGNLTEEYAMPFIAISLFIFLDYFLNGSISTLRLILCGLCLGGTLLLRPNMISLWLVMCFSIFVKEIFLKNWNSIIHYIVFFILGVLLIILPVLIWLMLKGALADCWNDYILFNMSYTSETGGRALFSEKWKAFFTFFNSPIFMITFFTVLFFIKDKRIYLNCTYCIYQLITLTLICMSGMSYAHYGIILIPAIAYPFSIVFSKLEHLSEKNIASVLTVIISVYLLSTQIMPNWIELIQTIPEIYQDRANTHFSDITLSVANYITDHTSDNEKISVYGNWDFIYILSNRNHATKYSYQFPIGKIKPSILADYIKQLEYDMPKIIVIQTGYFDNTISNFLSSNNYVLSWSEHDASTDGVLIYNHV